MKDYILIKATHADKSPVARSPYPLQPQMYEFRCSMLQTTRVEAARVSTRRVLCRLDSGACEIGAAETWADSVDDDERGLCGRTSSK